MRGRGVAENVFGFGRWQTDGRPQPTVSSRLESLKARKRVADTVRQRFTLSSVLN
ncbi:hypothetical protein BaRGS_00000950, partial [Batillaria attramentaria]